MTAPAHRIPAQYRRRPRGPVLPPLPSADVAFLRRVHAGLLTLAEPTGPSGVSYAAAMPILPTARATVVSVPDSAPLVLAAVDLGADQEPAPVRARAIADLEAAGLRPLSPTEFLPSTVVDGWDAAIGDGRLLLTSPSGVRVYTGELAGPYGQDHLEQAIAEVRMLVLLVGHLDVRGTEPMQAAVAAAAVGECVGGVVAARVTAPR